MATWPPGGRTRRPVAAMSSSGLAVGSQPSGMGTRLAQEMPSASAVAGVGTCRFQPDDTMYIAPSRVPTAELVAVQPVTGGATKSPARTELAAGLTLPALYPQPVNALKLLTHLRPWSSVTHTAPSDPCRNVAKGNKRAGQGAPWSGGPFGMPLTIAVDIVETAGQGYPQPSITFGLVICRLTPPSST